MFDEYVAVEVTPKTFIREMLGSYIDHHTDYSDWSFHGFPQSHRENGWLFSVV
jgi:hypothetical protein